jgi:DNA repair ATPase RecN
MKRFTTTLISLLLLITTSFSQPTLLSTKETKKDTAFSVSNDDINEVNHIMASLDACHEMLDSIKSELDNLHSLKVKDDNLIRKYEEDQKNLEAQVLALTELKDAYKKGEDRQRRRNKWVKGLATGFGIIAVLEAGYIGLSRLMIYN